MVLHRVVVGKIYSRTLAHHGGKARVKNALFQRETLGCNCWLADKYTCSCQSKRTFCMNIVLLPHSVMFSFQGGGTIQDEALDLLQQFRNEAEPDGQEGDN